MKRVRLFADTLEKVSQSLKFLENEKYLGCDTETEGLHAHSDRLWSIQISNEAGTYGVLIPINLWLFGKNVNQFLIDILAPFFADEEKTFIFHNAKFDIQFLRANGIELSNVFCTAIAEKLLTAGKLGVRNDLKSTLKRRFGIEMSKEDRKDFYDGTFSNEHDNFTPDYAWGHKLIDYSMNDVYPLGDLMKSQLKDIYRWKLQSTLALEMDVLDVTAKMEYVGIGIDAEGCRVFQMDMAKRAEQTLAEVLLELQPVWEKIWRRQYAKDIAKWDAWAIRKKLIVKQTNKRVNGKLTAEAVQERAKMDKLKPFTAKPKEKGTLKLRSAIPMKQTILSYCGLALPNTAKETLEQFRVEYPILEQILEYKKYAKLSEFGELYEKN